MCFRRIVPTGLLCLLLLPAVVSALPITSVRTVYLVPSDATYNPGYQAAIVSALAHLQSWYADQLGGRTFTLHDPAVAPVPTPHPSAYYSTNPVGSFDLWYWNNVITDAFTLTGARFNDPSHVWLFYIDAEPAPGQIGGAGTSGVAVLPQHDLRGLVGLESQPLGRWIGGLGHELGHGLGLPHPSGCPGPSCPNDALMWLGYITYPNTYLLPEERQHLLQSRFIGPVTDPGSPIPEPATMLLLGSGLIVQWFRRARRR